MTYFRRTLIVLAILLIGIFIVIFIGTATLTSPDELLGMLMTYSIISVFYYSSLSLAIRRLNDIGQSSWWSILILVPYLHPAVFIILLIIMLYFPPQSCQSLHFSTLQSIIVVSVRHGVGIQ